MKSTSLQNVQFDSSRYILFNKLSEININFPSPFPFKIYWIFIIKSAKMVILAIFRTFWLPWKPVAKTYALLTVASYRMGLFRPNYAVWKCNFPLSLKFRSPLRQNDIIGNFLLKRGSKIKKIIIKKHFMWSEMCTGLGSCDKTKKVVTIHCRPQRPKRHPTPSQKCHFADF